MVKVPSFRNGILSRLPLCESERLLTQLEAVSLPKDFYLAKLDEPVSHVYFPEDGLVSVFAVLANGRSTEAGLIGREGAAPMPSVSRCDVSRHVILVQVPGRGYRIDLQEYQRIRHSMPAMVELMERFS